MAKVGRPTKYSEEIGDKICEGIASGRSLVKICSDKDMPHPASVYRWLRDHEEFCENYARAREDQADYHSDYILDISDDDTIDPQHKRIMVDTRKWLASKHRPKKYGDYKQVEHSGNLGLTDLSGDELERRLQEVRQANEQSLAD
jgi:hypothetical protein